MTNVVGVESRGEAKRDVTLGAALTNDDKFWKIADFRKNFHKGVSDFQFQSLCFLLLLLLSLLLGHMRPQSACIVA